MIARLPFTGLARLALIILLTLATAGCTVVQRQVSPNFTIHSTQKMMPIIPFTTTLVPESFAEAVFNDYVDALNDARAKTPFTWFGIVKDDVKDLEKLLSPSHIAISGEVWSYIENSGCCSTELRVKSRLKIYRLRTGEKLWQAEIPMDSFFEHDKSSITIERDKLAKRLTGAMTGETLKALQRADIIVGD